MELLDSKVFSRFLKRCCEIGFLNCKDRNSSWSLINRSKYIADPLLLLIFQSISYHFWMITWIINVNNFPISNNNSDSGFCLAFAQFFATGVAQKEVDYEKQGRELQETRPTTGNQNVFHFLLKCSHTFTTLKL